MYTRTLGTLVLEVLNLYYFELAYGNVVCVAKVVYNMRECIIETKINIIFENTFSAWSLFRLRRTTGPVFDYPVSLSPCSCERICMHSLVPRSLPAFNVSR